MNKKKSFRFWKKRINKKGFTLTEVTVTLSILGIMTAISVPSYFSWLPRHRLQTSVRQIYDDMNLAKFRAVKDNKDVWIEFNTGTGTYTVFFDDSVSNGSYDTGETIIKSNAALENDVNITAANTCGFNNRGLSASNTGEVHLTNPSGLYLGVRVNTAGGISIISSSDSGANWS
ncbi:MAG: GspH/FimT family pseudopilin [Desulfobacterales bacterium]